MVSGELVGYGIWGGRADVVGRTVVVLVVVVLVVVDVVAGVGLAGSSSSSYSSSASVRFGKGSVLQSSSSSKHLSSSLFVGSSSFSG